MIESTFLEFVEVLLAIAQLAASCHGSRSDLGKLRVLALACTVLYVALLSADVLEALTDNKYSRKRYSSIREFLNLKIMRTVFSNFEPM